MRRSKEHMLAERLIEHISTEEGLTLRYIAVTLRVSKETALGLIRAISGDSGALEVIDEKLHVDHRLWEELLVFLRPENKIRQHVVTTEPGGNTDGVVAHRNRVESRKRAGTYYMENSRRSETPHWNHGTDETGQNMVATLKDMRAQTVIDDELEVRRLSERGSLGGEKIS